MRYWEKRTIGGFKKSGARKTREEMSREGMMAGKAEAASAAQRIAPEPPKPGTGMAGEAYDKIKARRKRDEDYYKDI